MQIDAPIQLAILEYSIIRGYTNYGIINQTIDPKVKPYIPMHKNNDTTY